MQAMKTLGAVVIAAALGCGGLGAAATTIRCGHGRDTRLGGAKALR
jgi:hypothetical protein